MAGTSIKKFMDFIWGEQDVQEEYDDEVYNADYADEYEGEEETEGEAFNIFKPKSKVVQMPQPQQIKMKISKPTNFDQADEIVMQL